MTISDRLSKIPRARLLAGSIVAGLVLGFGCAPKRSAHTQTPEPNLCDIDGGRWCQGCGGAGQPPCPAGSSGWLCCSGSVCVAVQTVGECSGGVSGWCSNYTEEQVCTGSVCVDVATCHDG